MKKEEVLASAILEHVGGKDNLRQLAHCMTRVRLSLKDPTKADIPALKQIDGVMGVIDDETLQIVVGPGTVNRVADHLSRETGLAIGEESVDENLTFEERTAIERQKVKDKQKSPFKRFLRRLGNIFIPLIPGLVASGIINGAANFAKNAGVDATETWMQILLLIGSTVFAYLAILVGWNTAKEFGGTPVLGAIAGGILFNPLLVDIVIYGEPLVVGRGGLFGVIFAAWLMTYLEKHIRRFMPVSIDIIFTPLFTVLIVGFTALYAIMPVAGVLSDGIMKAINVILEVGGPLAGAVLAGFFLPLVMVGLHHGLTPIHLELLNTVGNTALLPILAMAGAGQVGAAMAIFVKTRNQRFADSEETDRNRSLDDVTQPLLYGVTLPLGRPFLTACMGAAVGGAFQATMKTAALGVGVSGLSLTPLIDNGMYLTYIGGLVISYVFGFLFTFWFGFKEEMADGI